MKYFKQKLNKVLDKKDVKIPEKEFVKEHKRLIDVLESPSHKDDLSEAKEQRKELQSHLNKSEISFSAFNDGTVDLEAGPSVPEEIFNQVCLELSKSLDLIDIEVLEKKKKAFQFKSKHKSKKGGLTEAGRKAYNRATGSKLKRPQPGGGKRKKSFCARSKGQMKMHGINCSKTPDKRVCLARRRWACKSETESYFESLKKAKIYDFQSKKLLADFKTQDPTQEQLKEVQSKITPLENRSLVANKKPNYLPGKVFDSNEIENIYLNRFRDQPNLVDYIRKRNYLGHDEPYFGGDNANVAWRTIEKDAGKWNEPHPFVMYNSKKINLNGVLGKRVAQGGPDPLPWMDYKYNISKNLIKDHKDKDLEIHTRSDLIAQNDYLSLLNPQKHKIFIHLPTLSGGISRMIEPGAASPQRRLLAAQRLKEHGHDVSIVFDKIPGLEFFREHEDESPKTLNSIENEMKKYGLDKLLVNNINLTPKSAKRLDQSLGHDYFKQFYTTKAEINYFQALKKAKIIDFKTKKLLADFPAEQPKGFISTDKMGAEQASHLDSLRVSLPQQKMTDPEHFNSVLPHKDEKTQLDFLNTIHGDYNGDIGSRVRSGYLHVSAKSHLKLADHYLRNAAKRPAHQQETADRDLADAYEHLFLAKEKLKTKKPKKIKKTEITYFQELKKAIIKGPSDWWNKKTNTAQTQTQTKFKTAEVKGARTTYRNTPETDKLERVMHTVDVEIDGVPMEGQFEAKDPIDAIRVARDLLNTNPEAFKPKNQKSELIKDSDQERRKSTNPFGRRKSWDAIKGAYSDRRKSQRPIGFFDRRKGAKDRRMPNQPVVGRRLSRTPLKTVSAPQASPNAVRSTVSMQMEKSPFNQLYGGKMDQPIKAYRDQEDEKIQKYKNILLEKVPDQEFKGTISKFIDYIQRQPDRHYRSGAYVNQKKQQIFTPRTRHIRKFIESNSTYDKEKNVLRSKGHSFQFDPKTKKLTFNVHERHGSTGDFRNKFFGTKWEFNPQTNQVSYLGRTDRRQDQRRKRERRAANQFNPAFPNRRTSERRRGLDRRAIKSELNYFENLKKATKIGPEEGGTIAYLPPKRFKNGKHETPVFFQFNSNGNIFHSTDPNKAMRFSSVEEGRNFLKMAYQNKKDFNINDYRFVADSRPKDTTYVDYTAEDDVEPITDKHGNTHNNYFIDNKTGKPKVDERGAPILPKIPVYDQFLKPIKGKFFKS